MVFSIDVRHTNFIVYARYKIQNDGAADYDEL